MTGHSPKSLIETHLAPVSLKAFEGITTGFATARASWSRLDESQFRWLLAMNARARMRDHWEQSASPRGWTVAGNAALMGQTILVRPDERLTLRLLKENAGSSGRSTASRPQRGTPDRMGPATTPWSRSGPWPTPRQPGSTS